MSIRFRSIAAVAACLLTGLAATAVDDVDAWPLYQRDAEGTTVLYPLYVHEGDFLMVAPFYTRTREGRDHHLLWPLVKLSDGRLERVAPLYFSEHPGELTLLPLIRQTEAGTLWLVPPAWFSKRSDLTLVFPFYAQRDEQTWLAPNLYLERREGRLARAGSFLLLDWRREDERRELRLLTLGGARWGDGERASYLAPLYYARRSDDSELTWIAPYLRARGPHRESLALLPLYGDFRSEQRHTRWLGPWYQHEEPGESRRGLLPLFTAASMREPRSGATRHSLSLFAWLYAREQTLDAAGRRIAHRRRFALLSDELEAEGRRTLALFGLPVWERSAPVRAVGDEEAGPRSEPTPRVDGA